MMRKRHRIYFGNEKEQERLQLSGGLPADILLEILIRLPLKFLSNFRMVCKSWYNVICNHHFAKMQYAHAINSTSPSVAVFSGLQSDDFYLLDHQVFDNYQHSATPYSLKFDEFSRFDNSTYFLTLSSVNGLICFFPYLTYDILKPYCIWNPILQEQVLLPQSPQCKTIAVSGFGYDSINDKYKVVRILQSFGGRAQSVPEYVQYREAEAEIYTLGSGMWRSIKNVPYPAEKLAGRGAFLNGSCHWISSDSSFIVVFNLTAEQFHVIHLPAIINIPKLCCRRYLQVFDKCLCLSFWSTRLTPEFWVMKDYKKQEWAEEYDFGGTYDAQVYPVMKLKNGEVLCYKGRSEHKLCYFEPETNIFRPFMLESDRLLRRYWWAEDIVGSLFSPKSIENPNKSDQT